MSCFSQEPPQLEPTAEDFFDVAECAGCFDTETVAEGATPTGWRIRERKPYCPECAEAFDAEATRFECADDAGAMERDAA